jgi:hypothetical protein
MYWTTTLLKNGLTPNQVAEVLKKGYSLDGMKQEHGNMEQTKAVYSALLNALKGSTDTIKIADALEL